MNSKSFDDKRIARGYASDRPWLHKSVIARLSSKLKLQTPFHSGLDVGCGAGLSASALKLICDHVTGTDISPEMIHVCMDTYDASEFTFYVSKAEDTPLPETPYDIVTAAGVINWVDRDRFLKNMSLVTAKNALLIIYDFWISDKMSGNDAYTEWFHDLYLANFPKPPRKEDVWRQSDMPSELVIKEQETYQMQHPFSLDSFIRFMMTQSNVNVQIQTGQKTETEIHDFMEQTLSPIFNGVDRTLIFDAYSWYIVKK